MNIMQLLDKNDDPIQWMEPDDFDREAARVRLMQIVADLATVLDLPPQVVTGERLQDAIFHSEVFISSNESNTSAIRFSCFGDMVTIIDPEKLSAALLREIQDLLIKHGYVYVPLPILKQPYTGTNRGAGDGFRDWLSRYFGA
jgi:hypothetical protein